MLKKYLDYLLKYLDCEYSIWVEQEELGTEKLLFYKNSRYLVKIPIEIRKKKILRLKGLGKKFGKIKGDLYLHLWLNKGFDVRKDLWLSETSANNGSEMRIFTGEKTVLMKIPPNCYDGLTIRLKGLGIGPERGEGSPFLHREHKGDLLVKLIVYPDKITPEYGLFENLTTEEMALEGWVYLKYDELEKKLGNSLIPSCSISASKIASLFNSGGWKNIYRALLNQFRLDPQIIEISISPYIKNPGHCKRTSVAQNNYQVKSSYIITIHKKYINNPFTFTAILAHELCHIVYYEKIDEHSKTTWFVDGAHEVKLEEERMVDLLVFMFKMGEFQLRASRDKRLTFGYFNQKIFERMQIIVSKK